jgi:hypothetical protein
MMTVGNLRSLLTGLPEDMPVEFSTEEADYVDLDFEICSPPIGCSGEQTFVLIALDK